MVLMASVIRICDAKARLAASSPLLSASSCKTSRYWMRLSVKSWVRMNAICSRHTKPSWVTVLPFLTCCTTSSAVRSCLETLTTGTTSPTPLSSQSLSNSKPPSQWPCSSQLVIREEGDCLVLGRAASKPPKASRSLVRIFSALADAALLTKR